MAENVDFTEINKHIVAITSLRNQLSKSEKIDEITKIRNQILDIEVKILTEREKGLKNLQVRKEQLLQKTAQLQIELDNSKSELDSLNLQITAQTDRYRNSIMKRMLDLENDK